MLPTIDSGDDAVGVGGPAEWFWIVVGLGEEPVDGNVQVVHRTKHTTLQPPAGSAGRLAPGT